MRLLAKKLQTLFICKAALLSLAFKVPLSTWQLPRLLLREIYIFSNVLRQVIAEVKLSLQHSCQFLDKLL